MNGYLQISSSVQMVLLCCFSEDEDEDDESGNEECRDRTSEEGESEDDHGGASFVHERCESIVNESENDLDDECLVASCTSNEFQRTDHDYDITPNTNDSMLTCAQLEIEKLSAEVTNLRFERRLVCRLSRDPNKVRFYTGFQDYRTLIFVFQVLEPTASKMLRYAQYQRLKSGISKSNRISFPPESSLSLVDQYLLTLRKLRVGSFDIELADDFGVSLSTVSRIFIGWVNYFFFVLATTLTWPSRVQVQAHMPDVFKPRFSNTRVILDCTEIFVQKPSSLYINTELYSHYKGTTTLKGMVGIMPSGAVSFVSKLYAGSISDKAILKKSGLLSLLQPGDEVMVDKGFDVADILRDVGAGLVIPPFLTASRQQFEKSEVSETQTIARLRVHVERAIRRVKCYHFFDKTVPLNMVGEMDQIWGVCCILSNFCGDLL